MAGSSMSAVERSARARAAAYALHALGRTSTTAATAASMARFDREVDPEGVLTTEERARRAGFARKSYFAKLAMKAARARRLKVGLGASPDLDRGPRDSG
jgi:hypothetical protein